MIQHFLFIALCALASTSPLLAEGNGGAGNGFLEAAKRYDAQSAAASKAGDTAKATAYARMAQIKRDAAAHQGGGFDWTEYFALQKQVQAQTSKHHGGGLTGAAKRYAEQATAAREAGDEATALIYDRLSAIKTAAANHQGPEAFDWSEYHQLLGSLNQGKK